MAAEEFPGLQFGWVNLHLSPREQYLVDKSASHTLVDSSDTRWYSFVVLSAAIQFHWENTEVSAIRNYGDSLETGTN